MKKNFWHGLKFLALFFIGFISQTANAVIYAQLTSTQTQFIEKTNINKATAINARPIPGVISGIDWDEKKMLLTIKEDGIYAVISNVQYGIRQSKNSNLKGGDFFYWLEANGQPLTHSSNSIHVDPLSKLSLTEYYYALALPAGTQLRFMFSSSAADIGIVSFPGTGMRPNSPSLAVSIFKIGNIVTYM